MSEMLFSIPQDLFYALLDAQSEADVSQAFTAELPTGRKEYLDIDYLHDNLLAEFKYDADMSIPEGDRAKNLAQACGYCHRLRINGERVPPYIALIDKDEVVLYERDKLEHIYKNEILFKQGTPSAPDTAVIGLCKHVKPVFYQFINSEVTCSKAVRPLIDVCSRQIFVVDEIDQYNVSEAFSGWCNTFDKYMQSISTGDRPHIFEIDATDGGSITVVYGSTTDSGDEVIQIVFDFHNEIKQIENCKRSFYEEFWTGWKRVTDKSKQKKIFAKIYELMDVASRRRKGQFYTITPLAQRGWEYIEKVLGKEFWRDGTWRIWDNSAGQGGLILNVVPEDALQYTYLSTIDHAEVMHLKIHTAARRIFRFDFVNQLTSELPPELQQDMKDPNIKWLFFINPPYGEGSSGKETDDTAWHKKGVSQSLIRERMGRYGMLLESREKYAQFLFRIQDEFKGKFVLGLYSTMKVLVSREYINLRKFWRPQFKCGFICCAGKWKQAANTGQWPSIFSVFDCREKGKWGRMTYDILEYRTAYPKGIFSGQKSFTAQDTERNFREYFFPNENLPKEELTVVQSHGLSAFKGKSKMTNKRPAGTLASAGMISAYMRTQDKARGMVSGNVIDNLVPIFINRKNYKKILCGIGLYWSVKHTWVNHEDCFLAPSRNLTAKEKKSCMLYALLSERNRCTTAFLQETEINTKNGKVRNGGLVRAELNPFDKTLFDWSGLSPAAQKALEEYRKYCNDVVNWERYQTAAGRGVWGGHFLYERTKNGLDIENKKTGDGFPLPQSFKDAREALRLEAENIALELCF
ncbi:MAG: hypothetical protein LBH00_10745 [Planctomycetaceae bacterium]|jgi:hypothetical protein|nr:hypothetical protein [Planctomycetaceae bacterium]